jgi:hypothetical protein
MAKKSLVVLFIAAFAVGGAFAQAGFFSVGVGGFIGGDFGGGVEGEASGFSAKAKFETPYFGGGGYAFVDATYVELSLAVFGGSGKFKMTYGGQSSDLDISITNFNIGLLGKYPFTINDKLSLFPLLGIDYQICLSAENEDGDEIKGVDGNGGSGDFSALWFKFGGGLDYSFTEKIYLRFEALYGIRLENKFENDLQDYVQVPGVVVTTKTLLGHGLTAKLAVGYKF